ncbi:7TM diverse intracellular signaling domain-containing protein [Siphonobacter sp. SORGH_AS_1065]|uniref:sensor histidine kinase n=1 Tax=Siphonobacter sp. SORGH_AS_1065 TaxID=3041795 RepID=UPI0027867803|nr:7TM diverse intracellular signaling domain-containing protein [Siphonobacter sp. SORGH_AS_1065]MDQ1090014.1 signal transduction histidine kinase [Siphonobacter sp. SORGH_AS_1065]
MLITVYSGGFKNKDEGMGQLSITFSELHLFMDGMLLMMFLYMLLLFVQQRKKIYSLYALYILCITIACRLNEASYHLPSYKPGTNYIVLLFESLAFLLYMRFIILLMNLPRFDPISLKFLRAMELFLIGAVALDTLLWASKADANIRSTFYSISRFILAAIGLYVIPRILRIRNVVTPYFIIGSFFFILGCIVALVMGVTPYMTPSVWIQGGVVLEVLFFTSGIGYTNYRTEQEKIAVQAQLIEQLQENERKQSRLNGIRDEIARDLHDEIGSHLSSINILSQTIVPLVHDERVQQRLSRIGDSARQVMDSMREIVWSLNSSSDSLLNIGLRIQETAYSLFADSSTRLFIQIPESSQPLGLSERQRRELHLIVKEALTNVLRHARADQVWVNLDVDVNDVTLHIKDDGIGFDSTLEVSGLGMKNIRERASQMGATYNLTSSPESGTLLQISWRVVTNH